MYPVIMYDEFVFSAKILNDLGLLMTQKQKFVEAKKYFIEALDVLDSSCITNDNTHLKAVINQNLGAVLNFTKDFYKAIQRHTKAKNCYGKHLKHKANS